MKKPSILLIAAVLFAAGTLFAQTPGGTSGSVAPAAAAPGVPVSTPAAAPAAPAGPLTRVQVTTAKQATALIVDGEGSGTAFCVSESGMFITCNHVVEHSRPGNLWIVINPSEKDEKKYPAHILRTFPKDDLAVVKVDLDRKVPVLKLGDDSGLYETQELFAFGYPFGIELAHDEKSYPAISVNSGHVTSLRRDHDKLEAIQLDASLNPGNSGGPVLDDQDEVVGIVAAGLPGSGINFAIPVSSLKQAMTAPLVTVETPEVIFEKRFESADFAIAVDWLTPPAAQPAVTLEITSGGKTRSVAAAKGKDGKYHAMLPPYLPKPGGEKIKLQVTLEFENGNVTGQIDDFPLSIQGKPKLLSQIQTITLSDRGAGFFVDGIPAGALPELARMNVDIGGAVTPVNGQKAKRIGIVAPNQDEGPVTYKVTVAAANGGAALASAEGKVRIGSSPIVAGPSQLKGTTSLKDSQTIDLPSPADDVVAAEDGRLLIFHLKDVKKLAVFDVVDLKMRGYINLIEDPVFFAGGSRSLIVAYPTANLIVRYSLQTLQKDRTIPNPMGEIKNLVMGYSSPRYALFLSKGNGPYDMIANVFDVENMTSEATSKGQPGFNQMDGQGLVVRASADGRTYGVTRVGWSPTGFGVLSYKNDKLSYFYQHESLGLLVPNADGSLIYTSSLGVFTREYVSVIKQSGNWSKGAAFLPTYHPAYSISVPYEETPGAKQKDSPMSIALYMGRSDQPLTFLDGFNEMSNKDASLHSSGASPMTPDKRFHFYPQLNLFITIPATNDRVVAHPIDIKKILDDKGVDYLYVTTIPPQARISQRVNFKLEAVSKAGGVTYALQSGPAGLTVASDGTVNWQTPAKPTEESVIVSAKDTSGKEIYYTFQLVVTN